jgi:hypothetical protein
LTIDLGPLGTLQIDSPLPLTLGVRVTVQEIPASVTELDQARTLAALSGDLQSYLQFFSGPQATVQDVARALGAEALERTALALGLLVGGWYLVRFLRRSGAEGGAADRVRPHLRSVVVGIVVVGLVGTVLTSSVGRRDRPSASQRAARCSTALRSRGLGDRPARRCHRHLRRSGRRRAAQEREVLREANASLQAAWDERQELLDHPEPSTTGARRRRRASPRTTRTWSPPSSCPTCTATSAWHH